MRKIENNHGITIMELMIVVVIIGLMAAMAAPRFKEAIDRIKFRSLNRDIVSDVQLARSMAITNKNDYGISFNVDAGTVTLFEKDPDSASLPILSLTDSVISVDTLPLDMNYIYTDLTNNALVFNSNGACDFTGGGNIVTVGYNEEMIGINVINILPSTGRVKTYHYYY